MEKQKICVRVGTISHLSEENPILDLGEVCYDITNKKVKIGDGITDFNRLPYVNQYDDTNLKDLISKLTSALYLKADKADVYTKAETTDLIETKTDNISESLEASLKRYVDSQIVEIETEFTIDLSNYATTYELGQVEDKIEEVDNKFDSYYNKTETDSKLANKVDVVEGKSLISDDLITKVENITEYDDTELRNLISLKADTSTLNELEKKHDEDITTVKSDISKEVSDREEAIKNAISNYSLEELSKAYADVLKYIEYIDKTEITSPDGKFDLGDIWSSVRALENVIDPEEYKEGLKKALDELHTQIIAEIDAKHYLTEHQDISGKADKADVYTKTEVDEKLSLKTDKTYVEENYVLKSVYDEQIEKLEAEIDELRDIIEKNHSVIDDKNGILTLNTDIVGEPIVSEQTLTTPNLEVVSDDDANIILK